VSHRRLDEHGERTSTGRVLWSAANVLAFLAVLALNALAGTGSLSGESIGDLANQYSSYFLPANFTFGIWSLIYASLAGFAVFQATPYGLRSDVVRSIGGAWLLSCLLNVGWVVSFSFRRFGASLALMAALLTVLFVMHARVQRPPRGASLAENAFVIQPFGLYLAWISVAIIANSFHFLAYQQWLGLTEGGATLAAAMMLFAALLGVWMLVKRRIWAFPLVVAWALFGIGRRWPDPVLIHRAAYGLSALSVLVVLAWLAGGTRRGPDRNP
jgi:benzodiazapine receptor